MEQQGVQLKIVSPAGEAVNLNCDSVQLYLPDGHQEKGGGWVGIRRGHRDALMALAPGTVRARQNDAVISETKITGGVAFVENNVVTVLANGVEM